MKIQGVIFILMTLSVVLNGQTTSLNDQKTVHNHFYFNDGTADASFIKNAAALCPSQPAMKIGPPGKRGPSGERGPQGPPGRNGDPSALQRIQQDVGTVKIQINDLRAQVNHSNPGLTLVGHDSEGDFFVNGCEPAGCYRRDIIYEKPMNEMKALISRSQICRQFIKYHCKGSILYANDNKGADRRAWWVSRDGKRINSWGGAKVDFTCPCFEQGTCVPGWKCNCDRNDAVWRSDEGYITDKNLLPVIRLHFGDIGDAGEMGFHTLGKLECYS